MASYPLESTCVPMASSSCIEFWPLLRTVLQLVTWDSGPSSCAAIVTEYDSAKPSKQVASDSKGEFDDRALLCQGLAPPCARKALNSHKIGPKVSVLAHEQAPRREVICSAFDSRRAFGSTKADECYST
jgi:hypothetical protein